MDSGIGGLNVLASLIKRRCGEGYLYFSDNRNLPYGEKKAEDLREIALTGTKKLIEMGANVIVFGCNTLSVAALDFVRKRIKPPVFGLLPRPELLSGKAILMTTPTTALFLPKIESNVTLLTPANLAARLDADYPDLTRTNDLLTPLLLPYADAESIYLGCSHYLYAKETIRALLPRARVLDGCAPLASLIHAVLPQTEGKNSKVTFSFSGENQTERYAEILRSLLL